jgi:hypothetical protein
MTLKAFLQALDAGRPVRATMAVWRRLEARFTEVASHATGCNGALRIGRFEGRLVAVEEPDASTRAVRGFANEAAAAAFVKDRLAAYDRLWDG